jgi:hypothetical protein
MTLFDSNVAHDRHVRSFLVFRNVVRCRRSGTFERAPHRMAAAVGCLASAEHIRAVWEAFVLIRLEETVGNRVDWRRLNVEWPV